MTTTKDLLSLPDAARVLGVSDQTLRNWVKRDAIPHVVLPSGRALFRPVDLKAVLTVRGGT